MELTKVVNALNKYAPPSLAFSWDNVGLLVQSPTKCTVYSVLLTVDLTERVIKRAISGKYDLILTYHPIFMKPLSRVTCSTRKERLVSRCLEAGIAVYSPHTAYDALHGGVNDWLVSAFGEARVTPVEQTTEAPLHSHVITVLNEEVPAARLALLMQSFAHLVPAPKFVMSGKDGSINNGSKDKGTNSLSIFCNQKELPAGVQVLSSSAHGCEGHYVITRCEDIPKVNYGMGRMATLLTSRTIHDVIRELKRMTGVRYVRVSLGSGHTLQTRVTTGAVCAGSGVSVLRGVHATLLVTGEMSHHEVLEFAQTGRSVVLLEHSNSERGFLSEVLQPKLTQLFGGQVKVVVSQDDRDPLQIV